MKLTQLVKATKLHERIVELDKEITGLEKVALMIANGKTEIKLSLKVIDLSKTPESEKVTLDEDGFMHRGPKSPLNTGGLFSYITFGSCATPKEEKKQYDAEIKELIPDNVALQVLGVVLAGKMEARELAIKQLKKLGILI
jgi:hypothetical protein